MTVTLERQRPVTLTCAHLFPHFDTLIQTPADIQRLNETILQLAVQGKLVPQDPGDEPAGVLLERIAVEKARLLEVGTLGKEKQLSPISEDEVACELPRGWAWARLGDAILAVQTGPFGSTLHKSDYVENGTPVVNPANIQDDGIRILPNMMIGDNTLKRLSRYILEQGDIVMGRRGEMGRCSLVTEREAGWLCGSGSFVLKTSSEIFQPFLVMMIRAPKSRAYLAGGSVGATMNNLNHRILNNMVVALPPLAEQKRIVAKVDELFAQTRALEAKLRRAEEEIVVVNRAVLHRVQSAPDAATFAHAVHTLRTHFDPLTTDPRTLTDLRQTILQLAVQGKLVPQDPDDEPAGVLLERIGVEKERLVAGGRMKKEKLPPPINEDEIPFTLPMGWEWARLGWLVKSMTNGLYKPSGFYTDRGIISLRMFNIQDGIINLDGAKRLEVTPEELNNYVLEKGDLLINRVNSKELVGKAALIEATGENMVFESMNIRVRLMEKANLSEYVNLLLRSSYIQEAFRGLAKQAIGQASINQLQIASLPIPLPPLAEQKRIVAKVDELLARCDALAAKLGAAQVAGGQLTAAVLHGVVGD